ncbi:MAG: 5'/3'-nucleotidase SurE [Prevotella sp.]|nr:5'/3'-nucleotidase SurE [Prevotella sp.]
MKNEKEQSGVMTSPETGNKRPLILIANDDGYEAKGIKALIEMVRDMGDIIVCAPDGARSGQSRAFSTNVLTLKHVRSEPGLVIYRCSGTPVDCIKMAYSELCPRRPDLVLGGINHGSNASTNAQYSGTVGIAIEAAMKGMPAIAFSLCDFNPDADFAPMTETVRRITSEVLSEGLPRYVCLNVNYPLTGRVRGLRYCRMARGHWRKEVEKRQHPGSGADYYWMTGFYQCDEPEAEDTDDWALAHDYIAVTPLTVDLTDYTYLAKTKGE